MSAASGAPKPSPAKPRERRIDPAEKSYGNQIAALFMDAKVLDFAMNGFAELMRDPQSSLLALEDEFEPLRRLVGEVMMKAESLYLADRDDVADRADNHDRHRLLTIEGAMAREAREQGRG